MHRACRQRSLNFTRREHVRGRFFPSKYSDMFSELFAASSPPRLSQKYSHGACSTMNVSQEADHGGPRDAHAIPRSFLVGRRMNHALDIKALRPGGKTAVTRCFWQLCSTHGQGLAVGSLFRWPRCASVQWQPPLFPISNKPLASLGRKVRRALTNLQRFRHPICNQSRPIEMKSRQCHRFCTVHLRH